MDDKDSDLGAFLAGFVIGALVGAATAKRPPASA